MKIRNILVMIAFLIWCLLGPCSFLFRVVKKDLTWDPWILLGIALTGLYMGFDVFIAPETSLGYRAGKLLNPFWIYTPSIARLGGLLGIIAHLAIGWTAIASLLR